MFSGIKNGRPWSNSGYPEFWSDNRLITDLSEDQIQMVLEWIKSSIIPRKTPMDGTTSYGLKHLMERELDGLYTTNNQFKDAMLMCGFWPVDARDLNWVYCISKKSPVFMRFREKHGHRYV